MIKLLGAKILVRPYMLTITKGGIIIPETHQSPPTTGQIIAIGTDIPNAYASLKEGDWIKWYGLASDSRSPNWIKVDNEILLVVAPDLIIGIIDQPTEELVKLNEKNIILPNLAVN